MVELGRFEDAVSERMAQLELEDLERYQRDVDSQRRIVRMRRPIQRFEMRVPDYYQRFCYWKEDMISVGYPDDESSYIDDFIGNLQWHIQLRVSNRRSRLSRLVDAYYEAKFEETTILLERLVKDLKVENEINEMDEESIENNQQAKPYVETPTANVAEPYAHKSFDDMPGSLSIELKEEDGDSDCSGNCDEQHPDEEIQSNDYAIKSVEDGDHFTAKLLPENLYGKKVSLYSFPYIYESGSSVNGSSWISGLITDISKVSTPNLNYGDDVLGVSENNSPSLPRLGFNTQVFDPGTLALFKLHCINPGIFLVYLHEYGEFSVYFHLVIGLWSYLFEWANRRDSQIDWVLGIWNLREAFLWHCSVLLWNYNITGVDNSIRCNSSSTVTHVVWSNRPFAIFHVCALAQICIAFDQIILKEGTSLQLDKFLVRVPVKNSYVVPHNVLENETFKMLDKITTFTLDINVLCLAERTELSIFKGKNPIILADNDVLFYFDPGGLTLPQSFRTNGTNRTAIMNYGIPLGQNFVEGDAHMIFDEITKFMQTNAMVVHKVILSFQSNSFHLIENGRCLTDVHGVVVLFIFTLPRDLNHGSVVTEVNSFHISSKSELHMIVMFTDIKKHELDVDFENDRILMFAFDPGGFSSLHKVTSMLIGMQTEDHLTTFIWCMFASVITCGKGATVYLQENVYGTSADLVKILAHLVTSHPFDHGDVIGLKARTGVCVYIVDWGVTKACKPQMQNDVGFPSAIKVWLEMLINGTKIVGMVTWHRKLHGHKLVILAGATVLNNSVWDPGQDVISLYIIEDNDVLKRKGIKIQLALALKQDDISNEAYTHTGLCSLVTPFVSATATLIYVMRKFELMDALKLRSIMPVTEMMSWMLYARRIFSKSQQLPFCSHLFMAFQIPCCVLEWFIPMLRLVDYKGLSHDLGACTILVLEDVCYVNFYPTSNVAYTRVVQGAKNGVAQNGTEMWLQLRNGDFGIGYLGFGAHVQLISSVYTLFRTSMVFAYLKRFVWDPGRDFTVNFVRYKIESPAAFGKYLDTMPLFVSKAIGCGAPSLELRDALVIVPCVKRNVHWYDYFVHVRCCNPHNIETVQDSFPSLQMCMTKDKERNLLQAISQDILITNAPMNQILSWPCSMLNVLLILCGKIITEGKMQGIEIHMKSWAGFVFRPP